MRRTITLITVLALATSIGIGLAASSISASPTDATADKVLPFAESSLFVEINATDGDAGLQLDLDGEDWDRLAIKAPDGRTIMDVTGTANLSGYGLTGLTFESSEPPFDEHPLAEFKARFPEGVYRFEGETVDGRKLAGKARFTHDFPAGPVVTAPQEDAVVAGERVVVMWKRVAKPAGIKVIAYQVIVTQEEPVRVFQVDLPATARSQTVPADFLRPKTDYSVEVIAREKSGNQTITEVPFRTR